MVLLDPTERGTILHHAWSVPYNSKHLGGGTSGLSASHCRQGLEHECCTLTQYNFSFWMSPLRSLQVTWFSHQFLQAQPWVWAQSAEIPISCPEIVGLNLCSWICLPESFILPHMTHRGLQLAFLSTAMKPDHFGSVSTWISLWVTLIPEHGDWDTHSSQEQSPSSTSTPASSGYLLLSPEQLSDKSSQQASLILRPYLRMQKKCNYGFKKAVSHLSENYVKSSRLFLRVGVVKRTDIRKRVWGESRDYIQKYRNCQILRNLEFSEIKWGHLVLYMQIEI